MASRRPHVFPHSDEGSVLVQVGGLSSSEKDAHQQDDDDNKRHEALKLNSFRPCANIGLVILLLLSLLYLFGPSLPLRLDLASIAADLPDPLLEQMKADVAADLGRHKYTVKREELVAESVTPEDNNVDKLRADAVSLVEAARAMKASGVVMETAPEAKAAIHSAQEALRALLRQEYGHNGPYYVEMRLQFPESMPDFSTAGADGTILIELAPIALVPYNVYFFLEMVKHYKTGSFHRNAGHVQQAMVTLGEGGDRRGLAWQEYDAGNPHKQWTLGFAGRPGGPAFYISMVDNTDNHGPASQGSKSEADGCFGCIAVGRDVAKRMNKQPGKSKPNGFISDSKNFIRIKSFTLMSKDFKTNVLES